MAIRDFDDERGVAWQVWDTRPALHLFGEAGTGMHLHEDAVGGWLTFQSSTERRRFYQVPAQWERLADEELRRLCRHAVTVPTSRP